MKIGFLTSEYPHHLTGTSGGIGTSIFNLAKGLVQLNHTVSVIVYGQDKDEIFQENGITFYKVKNIKIKGLSLYLTQKKVEKLINSLYKEKKIEAIEAVDWTGFTAFIKPKCPLVIKIHGSDTYFCYLDNRPVKWINRFLEKKAFLQADAILSVSSYAGKLTNKVFDTNKDFHVIFNAIDSQQFQSFKSSDTKVILYFGTLIRKKGLLELPLIFNKVFEADNQIKLVLIGKDSPDKLSGTSSTWKMMLLLFNEKAIKNVNYIGGVPYSEMQNQIEKATVCVFPTFAEALPVSWIEAMAMGKAIVASNIGWASEIIDNDINGFIENPKDHQLFAKKIVQVVQQEQLQEQLGIEARIKVMKNFTIEVIAEKTIAFYSNLLEQKNNK